MRPILPEGIGLLTRVVMSKRARLNRVFAVIFIIWGSAIVLSGVARGLPSAENAYGTGRLIGFGFGFLLIAVGVWTLVRLGTIRRTRRVASVGIPIAVVMVVAAGFAASNDLRVSLADSCTDVMREEYDRSEDPGKAGLPPKAFAVLAPKMCDLGVERGLVHDDGTMSEQAGRELVLAVFREMGVARVQTLAFNELAVSQYHLAEPGEVTRWDRCVAAGYSGWDAQPGKESLPPRVRFFRAVREACAVGIERGIVPASGAPATGSPRAAALQQLVVAALTKPSA